MWYDGLFELMEQAYDDEQSKKMSAYMKNNFEFLGISKPKLDPIMKPFLKESRKLPFDWDFVFLCWEKPYREAQYVAVGYVLMHQEKLQKDDLDKIKKLIINKSWWETVDMLDAVCGTLVEKNPELKKIMLKWSLSDNIWLRRVSIDFQQRYKDRTDTELLEKILVNNLNSDEFFINKAIGWSLREYSKTDSNWVSKFLNEHHSGLTKLSVREASKYL